MYFERSLAAPEVGYLSLPDFSEILDVNIGKELIDALNMNFGLEPKPLSCDALAKNEVGHNKGHQSRTSLSDTASVTLIVSGTPLMTLKSLRKLAHAINTDFFQL